MELVLKNIPKLAHPDKNISMMREISKEEVEVIVMEMTLEKSLGHDGFTSNFFYSC